MTKPDFDSLEEQARKLPDPKDREELLGVIAEEKRHLAEFEKQLREIRLPAPPRPTVFANYTFAKFLRLLAGTLGFFGLCASAIFTVMFGAATFAGDPDGGAWRGLCYGIPATAACALLLYLTARKPHAERSAIDLDPLARAFARRMFFYGLAQFGLIAVTIIVMAIGIAKFRGSKLVVVIAPLVFVGGFLALERLFMRCPGCGTRLYFRRWMVSSSGCVCPGCRSTLQEPSSPNG